MPPSSFEPSFTVLPATAYTVHRMPTHIKHFPISTSFAFDASAYSSTPAMATSSGITAMIMGPSYRSGWMSAA